MTRFRDPQIGGINEIQQQKIRRHMERDRDRDRDGIDGDLTF